MPSKKVEIPTDTEVTELVLDDFTVDDIPLFDEVKPAVDDVMGVLVGPDPMPIPVPKVPMSLSSIADFITDIDDKLEFLTWVIYGKNGTGKTTLLSTADGVLILAAEDGTLSIRGKAKNAKKLKIDTWEKLESVFWLLKDGMPLPGGGIRIALPGGTFDVKYLAIDTVTKLSDICMRNVVLGASEKDASKDVLKKTMRDWGDMSEKMKYWMQQFEELPIQRVWLFQENSNSDDVDSDEFSIFPAVNKSLRTYIMSEADIIARTYIAKTETGVQYRISAAPNPNYVTKDRTSRINTGAINNPNLEKLYAHIFKS